MSSYNSSRSSSLSPVTRATTPESIPAGFKVLGSREDLQTTLLSNTSSGLPQAPCYVTDLFTYQVLTRPNALAIHSYQGQPITFAELDHLSACLATALPIQPKTIVPICIDVSTVMVATVLAVLRAGATYVLLDPQGSIERNKLIVHDTEATVVITEKAYSKNFDTAIEVENIVAKASKGLIRPKPLSPAQAGVSHEDPAYLIYTSGTTGRPKGVTLSHRAVTHGIVNHKLNGRRRWLLFYNPIFSAAQRTILATLCHGATLCLAPRAKLATQLWEIISAMQIDSLGITPSALATVDPSQIPACLKQITTVGEKFVSSTTQVWKNLVDLRVSYGCSEVAQLSLSHQIVSTSDSSNVGSPSDTTTAFVLKPDTFKECVPEETGELCFAGPQLATGYWKLPLNTAKSFVQSPFGRLYRSGDLAMKNVDGSIEIKGRIDHQIKIGGQRMEPEEVTSVLAGSTGVAAVCVLGAIVKENLVVVAAIVPEKADATAEEWCALVDSLRNIARKNFPSYMNPSYWLRCDKLPWNINLKVDIKQLRSIIEKTDPHLMLALRTRTLDVGHKLEPVRVTMRDVWAAELGLEPAKIDAEDSFVELGGSSIQAIQVLRVLREKGLAVELGDLVQPMKLVDIPYSKIQNTFDKPLGRLDLIQDASLRAKLISKRDVVDAYPVSALQESLLASTLQGETMYIYQRAYDVRHLDLLKLKLAFRSLFYMREDLRSTFIIQGQRIYRVVRNDFKFPWSERNDSLVKFCSDDKEVGMPLGEPFIRFTVLSKQTLVVSMHHALFDFWSHGFLYEDAAKLYRDEEVSERPAWGSYIEYLQQLDSDTMESFWREYMYETQPTIINHAPMIPTFEAVRKIAFNSKAISAALGATMGSIIYSAWALVLSQYTRSYDVAFATAISGRDAPLNDVDKLDGPTLTIVPQRVRFEPTAKLADLVQTTSSGLWQVNKHAQYGMRKVLQAAGSGNERLFDTFVNILVNNGLSKDATQDIFHPHGSLPMWETGYTTLQVEEGVDQLTVKLLANMEPKRVQFILDQVVAAVQAIVESPDIPVNTVNLVGPAEIEDLTTLAQPLPVRGHLLHSGFERIARQDPKRPALQWQTEKVYSYAELNVAANRMAAHLQAAGLAKGDLVPLLMEKSPFMVISILAVLKLGAAYVPLSPENPLERNLYIVQQISAKSVLTEEAFKNYFPHDQMPSILADKIDLSSYSPYFAAGRLETTDLAYVIFTSGSTGMPKGVQVSHGAVSAFADSMNDFLARKDDETQYRTLQFSNYVFDVSVYDIFTTLSSGSTLCMVPTDRLLSELATVITEMGVTHCFLTPTVVKLLKPSEVPTLKTLGVGGEPMTKEIIDTWADHLRLINGYGPTEASVIVSSCDISPNTLTRNIGQPLGKMSAAIMDPNSDRLLAYGAVGEVCFIGPQLAQGYHKDIEKTGKAFYTPSIPGLQRFYRSGDLARWLPNGELECLGRKDYQVKVNGFRIELGEIEASLLRTGVIIDTAVVVADVKQKAQLVAFVVFQTSEQEGILTLDGLDESVDSMKAGLATLTPYMIPRIVLPLAKMPKMPSGKIDRKGLKKIADALTDEQLRLYAYTAIGAVSVDDIVPITDERQRSLAEAWKEVLSLEGTEFGQEADFFKLGGDSIAAINLTSALRTKGFSIKVGEIMAASNLKVMSEVMVPEKGAGGELIAFEPSQPVTDAFSVCDYESIYPCPPGQSEFLESGSKPQSFWTLMATRKLAPGTVVTRWLELVRRLAEANEILRTTFAKVDGRWYGAVLRDSSPVSSIVEVDGSAEQRERLIHSVWASRFQTGKPFIRYLIMRSLDGSLEVCTKLDHGLYDGTLLRIFAEQMSAIVSNAVLPVSTPFTDFALHEWRSDKAGALSFWLNQQRRTGGFKYPATRQQPSISASVVHMCSTPLEALTKQHALSASVVYQAAFSLWLSCRSGSATVSYDYLYTGRNVPIANSQSINGTCANFLPLCTQVGADSSQQTTHESESVKTFINRIQAEFWAATENGNVGLDDIYAAAGTTRQESGNKTLFLFQPFEPPVQQKKKEALEGDSDPEGDQKWIVMALSEVKMPQPYAVVCEVIRTVGEEHKLRLGYDPAVFNAEQAMAAARDIGGIVEGIANGFEGPLETLITR